MHRFIALLLVLSACGLQKSKEAKALDDYVQLLPEIKPGYFHDPYNDDPEVARKVENEFEKKHFPHAYGLVGYWKTGDVTCILAASPADDMTLELYTFVDGKGIDSKTIANGGGYFGCDFISITRVVGMVTENMFRDVSILVTQECDSLDEAIPGTQKEETSTTITMIQPDGKIGTSMPL